MKKWWILYLRAPWDKRVLWSAAVLALIPFFGLWLRPIEPPESPSKQGFQADTYIPKGFVLVPIEVQNYEALDSILGPYGLVDLFTVAVPGGAKAQLMARNVKLLRAPQNPSHFAVLIPEDRSATVLRLGGAFTVIVKRPNGAGTEFVKEEISTRRSITYEGG